MRAESSWTFSSTVPCPRVAALRDSRSLVLFSSAAPRMSSASCTKSAFLATKSVSELSSIIAPSRAATMPLAVVRPARLPTSFAPLMRSASTAVSRSPSDCSRAFLQSIIPDPVRSRSFFTSAAV